MSCLPLTMSQSPTDISTTLHLSRDLSVSVGLRTLPSMGLSLRASLFSCVYSVFLSVLRVLLPLNFNFVYSCVSLKIFLYIYLISLHLFLIMMLDSSIFFHYFLFNEKSSLFLIFKIVYFSNFRKFSLYIQ